MFKKIKNIVLWVFAGIGAILGIFLLASKKKPVEIDREEAANKREVDILKKQITVTKETRKKLETDLTELKTTADGRSKQVKEAKKAVKNLDSKIQDLENQLGIK
jgi:septal ring factor EnvC (AmiA/AmiB activator)